MGSNPQSSGRSSFSWVISLKIIIAMSRLRQNQISPRGAPPQSIQQVNIPETKETKCFNNGPKVRQSYIQVAPKRVVGSEMKKERSSGLTTQTNR